MKLAWLKASFSGRLVRKLMEDQGQNWALVIAWNALFSLFPIVLVAAAVLGWFFGRVGVATGSLDQRLVTVLPASAQPEAVTALATFHQRSGIFLLVGIGGLIWSGSSLFGAMEQAFDTIYHATQRPFLKQKLMSVAMILVFTLLAGIDILSSSLLTWADRWLSLVGGPALVAAQAVVGTLAGWLLFLVIYKVVPNCHVPYRRAWPGALLAGILLEALALLFPLYLRYTGTGTTYGKTFGLLFLVLNFFYFLGLVTMVGVEVNSLLAHVDVHQPEGATALRTTPAAARPGPSTDPGHPPEKDVSGPGSEQGPGPGPGAVLPVSPTGPQRRRPVRMALAGLTGFFALEAVRRARRARPR